MNFPLLVMPQSARYDNVGQFLTERQLAGRPDYELIKLLEWAGYLDNATLGLKDGAADLARKGGGVRNQHRQHGCPQGRSAVAEGAVPAARRQNPTWLWAVNRSALPFERRTFTFCKRNSLI